MFLLILNNFKTHNDSITHTGSHETPNNSKLIFKTLGILTAITLLELFVGMYLAPKMIGGDPHSSLKIWFNIFYLICTLAKAYYIVAEFMHLGHEVKNLIMTIIFPLTLFIWFIIAFLWEGNSYKHYRDTYNKKEAIKLEQHSTTEKSEHHEKK
jgi:cytochrome c oxidase subunit IV